jgi:hypothetical protein
MVIFQSEADLLDALARHDDLVRRCARKDMPFDTFCKAYNDFYAYYALDGHESDEEERLLLERYDHRLELHRIVTVDILGQVCSEDDASNPLYVQAGRYGSAEAVARIERVSAQYL